MLRTRAGSGNQGYGHHWKEKGNHLYRPPTIYERGGVKTSPNFAAKNLLEGHCLPAITTLKEPEILERKENRSLFAAESNFYLSNNLNKGYRHE